MAIRNECRNDKRPSSLQLGRSSFLASCRRSGGGSEATLGTYVDAMLKGLENKGIAGNPHGNALVSSPEGPGLRARPEGPGGEFLVELVKCLENLIDQGD